MKKILLNNILAVLLFFSVIPIKYFFGAKINFLPLQFIFYIFILFIFYKINIKKNILIIDTFFVLYFIIVTIYNIMEPFNIFTNPVIITLITIIFILHTYLPKNLEYLDKILKLFFIFFIIFSLYLNIQHMMFFGGFSVRSKGFGSGTLYATLSIITILYFLDKFLLREINKFKLFIYTFIPIWSLILTQSRGALLTFILAFLIRNKSNILKYKLNVLKILKWIGLLFLLIVVLLNFWKIISQIPFIKRFELSSYKNVAQFTSNRLPTQEYILEDLSNENSVTILFGKGLNSIKKLVYEKGLEFPHFDLLYVLYDGGLFSVIFYLIFIFLYVRKSKLIYYPLIYFFSSFHTNMIISPAYLVLLYLLSTNFYYKKGKG